MSGSQRRLEVYSRGGPIKQLYRSALFCCFFGGLPSRSRISLPESEKVSFMHGRGLSFVCMCMQHYVHIFEMQQRLFALQDWHDMGPNAEWRSSVGEFAWLTAFKDCEVPLRSVPGLEHAGRLHPDTMHNFHIGWGQDLAASSICMLARFKMFGNIVKFDVRLESAHKLFLEYCHDFGKTTGCDMFSKMIFDMGSRLCLNFEV